MNELCKDLKLSIFREPDPKEKDREQIRIKLADEMQMMEVETCQQINITTHQSRRYHVLEATIIGLRKLVSEAFREGMISDSLGSWQVTRPVIAEPSSTKSEIDLDF
jgi:hypothetical protein